MKKLIALIIIAASVFCFAACDSSTGDADGVAKFTSMLEVSAPTKVLTNRVVSVGGVEFTGTESLVTGVTASGKHATVQVWEYETIQSIENGAGDIVLPIEGEPIKGSREYFEGRGERYDGGGWDPEGYDFAPVPGSIPLNITEDNITDVTYTENKGIHTLIFTVPAANVGSVFAENFGVESDAKVIVVGNGAEITGITVSYTMDIVSENEDVIYPDADVTISVAYSYVLEQVTLVK